MKNTIPSLLKRHSLALFVVLAYLLSWSIVLPTGGLLLSWGPMLAALIVMGLSQGHAGVKTLWSRMANRSGGLLWAGVAVAIPVGFTLLAIGLNLLLGARLSSSFDWSASFRSMLLLLLVGGQWEEPGWTGFALPHLLRRFSKAPYGFLTATLITAVIRLGWHLPLVIYGRIYWSDMLMSIAFQIVLTWLFTSSRNSGWVVMLCHLVNNLVSGQVFQYFFSGTDWLRDYWLRAILWSVLAAGVLILAWVNQKRGRSPQAEQVAPLDRPVEIPAPAARESGYSVHSQ